ncbi:glycoside hydrolase family 99-like domain-containing protein [Megalodesulfovibrio gigas]|uniref:glycoside hydrolase family 99-like domain-containing protein n=1 Tax=Megalodesulfovibrio gigas TaxID=879 RepID=UPI0009DC2774|nr:glycoside hydrolase family 99-like domain-containing protein [Megalodesulfovibrio gigas]
MNKEAAMQDTLGLSFVVVAKYAEDSFSELLAQLAVIKNNRPVECIVINHYESPQIKPVVDQYCRKLFIRYIDGNQQKTMLQQLDFWANKAKHPLLLLLYRPLALNAELLGQTLERLTCDPNAAALALGREAALTDGFLLVRREQFLSLEGLGSPAPGASPVMDFCHRLKDRLNKNHVVLDYDMPPLPESQPEAAPPAPVPAVKAKAVVPANKDKAPADRASRNHNLQTLLNNFKLLLDYLAMLNENKSDMAATTEELLYGILYPDVKAAVTRGDFTSCKEHYDLHGAKEGRLYSLSSIVKKYSKTFNLVKDAILVEGAPGIDRSELGKFNIVPFYFAGGFDNGAMHGLESKSICVHLHLFYQDMLPILIQKLNNIPYPFTLFVSVPQDVNHDSVAQTLRKEIRLAKHVVVEPVPNKGRDIAPFIVQFGSRILDHDYVLHIHTKQSLHTAKLKNWGLEIFDLLLGDRSKVSQILMLLRDRAKIIYPEGQTIYFKDPTGWAGNHAVARDLLRRFTDIAIDEFPVVEFAEGTMAWARTSALAEYLSLPLTWDDFPPEPITSDGSIAHALERLPFILAYDSPGEYFKICKRDSIDDHRFYEEQQDYRQTIVHKNIKALAYYLPQFHPIPENDLWHGKGFTEWTKVKAATPLFAGHYQQHIPHPDIDYYLLDNPDILRQQAEMMQRAGMHGSIFYHYWFTGKLILEEPAQMLLDNTDINMPFCFCWANENWTRCWDGNESEILLEQKYSDEDAAKFINYLIPFFKDSRYIKIEDRPVLFIYRPSSIADAPRYQEIWKEQCQAAGLKAPYVVAVLTRGASSPTEYAMDAAVERVLHDWTNGNVAEMKELVHAYYPLKGSILNYDEVANYYMQQQPEFDFTYFRSIIPNFDNTARYGASAILTHQNSPVKFQAWFENLVQYSNTLPPDRQFVVVNAWNEWAEGAHLEPDTRFGYGFLNAIGRALSDLPYGCKALPQISVPPGIKIFLEIPKFIEQAMADDAFFKRKFLHNLGQATLWGHCTVQAKDSVAAALREVFPHCPVVTAENKEAADFVVQFRRPAFLAPDCLENMLRSALQFRNSIILSNCYDNTAELVSVEENGSVSTLSAYNNALALLPPSHNGNFKLCTQARVFVTGCTVTPEAALPEVTTVVRIHPGYSITCLRNALLSLLAMHSCVAKPLVAVQNFSQDMRRDVETLLASIFPAPQYYQIEYFDEPEISDLRTRMLNEGIRRAKTRYVGFLDFDDLLMNDAYSFLISEMQGTGKAVAFGRVFATNYYSETQELVVRNRTYEYGFSYEDFLTNNCLPLHSFLMDKSQIDFNAVQYFDDMIFLEDYFFLMQVLTQENAHWPSLQKNRYVGDYIHTLDRAQSLACADTDARSNILNSECFKRCTQRIEDLRAKITAG